MKAIGKDIWKKYFLGNKDAEERLFENWCDHNGAIILDDGADYREIFYNNWLPLFCDSFFDLIFKKT